MIEFPPSATIVKCPEVSDIPHQIRIEITSLKRLDFVVDEIRTSRIFFVFELTFWWCGRFSNYLSIPESIEQFQKHHSITLRFVATIVYFFDIISSSLIPYGSRFEKFQSRPFQNFFPIEKSPNNSFKRAVSNQRKKSKKDTQDRQNHPTKLANAFYITLHTISLFSQFNAIIKVW